MSFDDEVGRMDAVTLAGKIRAGELSAVEVTEAALRRMERLEPLLHAFCTPTPELARATAQRIDKDIRAGREVGPLAGVPIGIKDLVATKGVLTTSGSIAYRDFVPDEDSGAVERLREMNPMLGLRGVRLGIHMPELVRMQVRAIFEAACNMVDAGIDVFPKIMIPLVTHGNELRWEQKALEE